MLRQNTWMFPEAVLIESDWNLKYNDADVRSVHMDVLIESDWNLKAKNESKKSVEEVVLIESDWNLKSIKYS